MILSNCLSGNINDKDHLRANDNALLVPGREEALADPLYESLVIAITLGYTAVATSLLDLGVNPNKPSRGRLGQVTAAAMFIKSNPLHFLHAWRWFSPNINLKREAQILSSLLF